jgi:hypothetical protein
MIRILVLLATLALSSAAQATCAGGACFWIGGTGTLNLSSDSAHWSTSSGGATCSCEPATGDDITFDGSSGGGTVTVNVGGTWTANNLTVGAFTGTLDFATNNNNLTVANIISLSGTGTRTINMGNGTWTLTGNSGFFNNQTTTNETLNANSSTISFTGSGGTSFRRLQGGGKTYSTVSVSSSTNNLFIFAGANTYATLTLNAPNRVQFGNSLTQTVTTMTNITGSAGSEIAIEDDDLTSGLVTISSANNFTCTWCAFKGITFTGGGTFTANNSFDLGQNTGITINAPSGGAGGSNVIGGGL